MTPTPDDIRKAREIAEQAFLHGGPTIIDGIAQALRAEREAERERCAEWMSARDRAALREKTE